MAETPRHEDTGSPDTLSAPPGKEKISDNAGSSPPSINNQPRRTRYQKAVLILTVSCLVLYVLYWFSYKQILSERIDETLTAWKEQDITVTQTPSISGFPFAHHIVYSGDIIAPSGRISIPRLEIGGVSLLSRSFHFTMPEGFVMTQWAGAPPFIPGRAFPDARDELTSPPRPNAGTKSDLGLTPSYPVDYLELKITVPRNIDEVTLRMVEKWHKDPPNIILHRLLLRVNSITFKATGEATLDENLQPQAEFMTELHNYEIFLKNVALNIKGNLPAQLLIAGITGNLLHQAAPASKDSPVDSTRQLPAAPPASVLRIPLAIKSNILFINGVAIMPVPYINWQEVIEESG